MSTLDVVAYAGEEFGGVQPANFLDIGGGASAEVMANGLEIILCDPQVKSVFVNVFGGITACDAVANGILQAFELLEQRGTPVNLPLVVRLDGNNAELGPRDPRHVAATLPPAPSSGSTPWTAPPAGRPSWPPPARDRGPEPMAIWLTHRSKVIVQGMTGSEGRKHTQRMLNSGTNIVGGVTPGKGGQTVEFNDHVEQPVFGSVAEAVAKTGADVSVIFVPAKGTKAAVVEAVDAGVPLVVVITEGVPVHDTADFFQYAQDKGDTRIIGPNCPGLISPGGRTSASSRPTSPSTARSAW